MQMKNRKLLNQKLLNNMLMLQVTVIMIFMILTQTAIQMSLKLAKKNVTIHSRLQVENLIG